MGFCAAAHTFQNDSIFLSIQVWWWPPSLVICVTLIWWNSGISPGLPKATLKWALRVWQGPSEPQQPSKRQEALQCWSANSSWLAVAKGGEVYPCPPSPFWIYDLPLKASLSTCETFTLFVQLCVFLKTKIRRSFLILGKRSCQSGCCETLLEKFTGLRAQLQWSSAVCLSRTFTGSRVTELTLLIHQTNPQYWFLSLRTSFFPSSF